jgi:sugar/nucleoside kinase (ribokinase family)
MVDLTAYVDEKTLNRMGASRGNTISVSIEQFDDLLMRLRKPLERSLGGSAVNVACALARMYGRTTFLGRVGIDSEALYCRKLLKEEGVLSWFFLDRELKTGRVLILVTPDGERSMISCLAAADNFKMSELTGSEFHRMGIVHFEGYQLNHFEATLRMMKMSVGAGAMISLDLASKDWVRTNLKEFRFLIYEFVDILFGNLSEMQTLMEIEDPQTICQLLSTQVHLVCLTMGDKGVWIGSNDQAYFFPTTRVDPIDTTGAGDLFCAGILHGLRWGWNLKDGVALAQDLASTGVQRKGSHLLASDWDRIRSQYRLEEPGPNLGFK